MSGPGPAHTDALFRLMGVVPWGHVKVAQNSMGSHAEGAEQPPGIWGNDSGSWYSFGSSGLPTRGGD